MMFISRKRLAGLEEKVSDLATKLTAHTDDTKKHMEMMYVWGEFKNYYSTFVGIIPFVDYHHKLPINDVIKMVLDHCKLELEPVITTTTPARVVKKKPEKKK